MDRKLTVNIVGASGYAGGELIRLLLQHPFIEIQQVTSRKYAKFPITLLHPNLRGKTDLKFSHPDQLTKSDILFLALPNGESQKLILKYLDQAKYIIDLGSDFRLRNISDYKQWYKAHLHPELLKRFVYGLPELHRAELKDVKLVATPGCEATCSILALYPLMKEKLVNSGPIIIDTKIGSSAAGAKPGLSTHHPERAGVVRSYKLTNHRHTAEMRQELGKYSPLNTFMISATAIEMVRGILVTAQTFVDKKINYQNVVDCYRSIYGNEPFVRIITDKIGNYRFPEPKILQGTNYVDIGFELEEETGRLVVVGAIDNLTKGTAGQAIQSMNLMCGFPETIALEYFGLHPV